MHLFMPIKGYAHTEWFLCYYYGVFTQPYVNVMISVKQVTEMTSLGRVTGDHFCHGVVMALQSSHCRHPMIFRSVTNFCKIWLLLFWRTRRGHIYFTRLQLVYATKAFSTFLEKWLKNSHVYIVSIPLVKLSSHKQSSMARIRLSFSYVSCFNNFNFFYSGAESQVF